MVHDLRNGGAECAVGKHDFDGLICRELRRARQHGVRVRVAQQGVAALQHSVGADRVERGGEGGQSLSVCGETLGDPLHDSAFGAGKLLAGARQLRLWTALRKASSVAQQRLVALVKGAGARLHKAHLHGGKAIAHTLEPCQPFEPLPKLA
jgi:hypothetical protein